MSEVIKGKWSFNLHCVECDHIMTDNQKMYSEGICPYCAWDSSGTVCSTVKKPYRFKYKKYFFGLLRRKVGIEYKYSNNAIDKTP